MKIIGNQADQQVGHGRTADVRILIFHFQPFQQGTTFKFKTFKVQREAALVEWQQLCAA
jgi:hypothetical protein